jgi:uncharacterized surface protein with fasciclin (FAS1) repeats
MIGQIFFSLTIQLRIDRSMRYSLKFFTQSVTFLGVSSLLIFSTFKTKAISPTQQQQLFPKTFPQLPAQPQLSPNSQPLKIQPLLKPGIIIEIDNRVQDTEQNQNSNNPFRVNTSPDRRGGKTLVELLKGSTFYNLLKLAELQDILKLENQNLVIFAPTEAPWEALGDQLQPLMQPENIEQLRQLLQNHIVEGDGVGGISDEQFQQGSVQTLGGKTIQIKPINENKTEVNGIEVLHNKNIIQAIDQNSIIVEIDQFLFEPEL